MMQSNALGAMGISAGSVINSSYPGGLTTINPSYFETIQRSLNVQLPGKALGNFHIAEGENGFIINYYPSEGARGILYVCEKAEDIAPLMASILVANRLSK